jgi:FAD/FMN-containing dehydrogenase
MQKDFPGALAAIVGAKNVLTAESDMAPYVTDWRKHYHGSAICVVRPAATSEVSAVVRLCAEARIAVVPQGGNTGLSGGSVPTGKQPEIVLSLSRMNRIRDLDVLNGTLTAEAGCVLADIQRAADDAGRLFALSLAAEGSCQIGGNLSTNAGGVNVLRYGNSRDQVLGLEAVLPDGRVWDGLRGLRKDNTGYDLKQLFIGAEGTLGVITAAVLKLYPKPSASATAWVQVDNPQRTVELLNHVRNACGDRLTAFELLSKTCVDAVFAHRREIRDPLPGGLWYVLLELSDSGKSEALRELLEQALDSSLVANAVLAKNDSESKTLWKIRESVPESQFANVKHDISVSVSKVPEFIELASASLGKALPGEPIYCFGHVGDGNLHYNVGDAALLAARRDEVNRIVYDIVAELKGSISAEHGLGQLKRGEISRHKNPLELELMRSVKRALDPQGLMNPGKVL